MKRHLNKQKGKIMGSLHQSWRLFFVTARFLWLGTWLDTKQFVPIRSNDQPMPDAAQHGHVTERALLAGLKFCFGWRHVDWDELLKKSDLSAEVDVHGHVADQQLSAAGLANLKFAWKYFYELFLGCNRVRCSIARKDWPSYTEDLFYNFLNSTIPVWWSLSIRIGVKALQKTELQRF